MRKRFLSIILVLILILSGSTTAAFGEPSDQDTGDGDRLGTSSVSDNTADGSLADDPLITGSGAADGGENGGGTTDGGENGGGTSDEAGADTAETGDTATGDAGTGDAGTGITGSGNAEADDTGADGDEDWTRFDNLAGGSREVDHDYEIEEVDLAASGDGLRNRFNADSLPSKYICNSLPDLRSQNPYGTCWAFSSIALAEISLVRQGYYLPKDIDLSELQLAYFTYHSVTDPLGGTEGDSNGLGYANYGGFLDNGGNIEFSQNVLASWMGAASETLVPYGRASKYMRLDDSYAYNDEAHLSAIYRTTINTNDLDPVKKLIYDNGAVGISFCSNGANYDSRYNSFYTPSYCESNHAVAVVGWDDEFPADHFRYKAEGDGAWLVRNSWTRGTFDNHQDYNGYFWLSYYDHSLYSNVCAFRFSPSDDYDNNYQYDGSMFDTISGASKGANVFRAHSGGGEYGEILRAASFSTINANVDYRVDIYTDLEDASDPESGTWQTGAEGSIVYPGYYEVELDDEVSLDPGEDFSVVVTLSHEDRYPSIVCEGTSHADWYDCVASASAGQSFAFWGNNWYDFGTQYNGNLRIKAFTDDDDEGDAILPTDLSFGGDIAENGLDISVEENVRIEPVFTPSDTNRRALTWESSDPDVASVSSAGVVSGIGVGTCTVTARSRYTDITKSFEVRVNNRLLSISIEGPASLSRSDAGAWYSVKTKPSSATVSGNVIWSSSDPSILDIDEDGYATVLHAGSVSISAELDGKTASRNVDIFMDEPYVDYSIDKDNVVTLSWDAVEGADAYSISRDFDFNLGNPRHIALIEADGSSTYSFVDRAFMDNERPGYAEYVVWAWEGYGQVGSGTPLFIWIPGYDYTISYVMNGLRNDPDNPHGYRRGQSITLKPPLPSPGYRGGVWYQDAALTKEKSGVISSDKGNITFYAKPADPISYRIRYNYGYDGLSEISDSEYLYTDSIKLIKPERAGYTFREWNTEADGSGTGYATGVRACALTTEDGDTVDLFAQWDPYTGWVKTDGDWRYYEDGEIVRDSFVTVGGAVYYLRPDGSRAVGICTIPRIVKDASGSAVMSGDEAVFEDAVFYFNRKGVMQTGWISDGSGSKRYYDPSDGGALAVSKWIGSGRSRIYVDASGTKPAAGVRMIEGREYCIDTNGQAKTGWIRVTRRAVDPDTGADESFTAWYYYDPSSEDYGALLTAPDDGDPSSVAVMETEIGGRHYLIDESGMRLTGWSADHMRYYDTNGALVTGLKKIGSDWYYFYPTEHVMKIKDEATGEEREETLACGTMATGLVVIDGKLYLFGDDGRRAGDGQTVDLGGASQSSGQSAQNTAGSGSGNSGASSSGSSGASAGKTNRSGVVKVENAGFVVTSDGREIYVTESGKILTDAWVSVNTAQGGQSLGGILQEGSSSGSKLVRIGSDGTRQKGVTDIGGKLYVLGRDGSVDSRVTQAGWYAYDESGNLTALDPASASSRAESIYVNADGTVCTGWVDGAGVRYYYDKEGKRQADTVVKIGRKLYGFDGSGALLGGGMYVRSESGGQVTYSKTSDINSASYIVDPDGSVNTGWYAVKDDTGAVTGQYYFSQDTGAKLKDVHKIGTGRYYFDRDTGLMRTSAGWIDEDGASEGEAGHHRYYVNQNGELATGWLSLDDGTRYYLGKDGERRDGVLKVGVRLYYQTPGGIVTPDNATDVVKAHGSGITKTVLCRIGGGLIYINHNGTLKTGWKDIEGKSYYFDKTGGFALTGYQQIAGRWYIFDAAGVLCD